MKQIKLSYLILGFALVAGTVLRVFGIVAERQVGIDEGISYLVATGHEGEYIKVVEKKIAPYGSWVDGGEWKKFVRRGKIFCFRLIGSDLAQYDVHPPLYFWLLHAWFLIFGASPLSGRLLNVALFIPSALALYGLARYCLRNFVEASLVAFIWSLSPAVIRISFVSRNYGLLVLLAIIFVGQTLRLSEKAKKIKWRDFVFLAMTAGAGVMTHYHFFLLVGGCALYAVFRLGGRERLRLAAVLVSLGVGCSVLFWLHPYFYRSFLLEKGRDHSAQYVSFLFRLKKLVSAYLDFFIGNKRGQLVVLGISAVMVIGIMGNWVKKLRGADEAPAGDIFTGSVIIYFLIWVGGSIGFLYLAGISSLQQMGRRYLSMVYPFLAFLPVLFFRFAPKLRSLLISSLSLFLVLSASAMVWRFGCHQAKIDDSSKLLAQTPALLIDTPSRLFLPRIIWYIPDNKRVFVAGQDFLLKHIDAWLDDGNVPFLYISRGYKWEKEKQQHILDLINQIYRTRFLSGGIAGLGDVFEVQADF